MISAIIQARVSSTRLPNKIFSDIEGKPLIYHIFNRISYSKKIDNILLATTNNPADDKLTEWAKSNNIPYFRGSEEDVLSRYYNASKSISADIIARITADDPFKDPIILDKVIDLLVEKKLDFAYNNKPPTFPEGLDIEVFTFKALEKANIESKDDFEREHVTQYFYRHSEIFNQENYLNKTDLSKLRWTIDTEKDLEMTRMIYKELYKPNEIFLLEDILNILKEKPYLAMINSNVKRSAMYTKNEGN